MKEPLKIKLKTGDIIITSTKIPLIDHFGVVVIEDNLICIYHCTPFRGVVIDTLVEFFKDRDYKNVRKTSASKEGIYMKYKGLKRRDYDLDDWNCVHYANYLTS
jgi:hypothetical protein